MLFVKNASYTASGRAILRPLSLDVGKGQDCLVLGPSGCGKTTLLYLMAGMLRAGAGEVVFGDHSYSSMSEDEMDSLRAAQFGFVFQRLHLIGHLTVWQNIALAQTKGDESRLNGLIDALGLSSMKHQKAQDLSVGEAQRVAIARAVANNPAIIFADEPTSSLDDKNTDVVMDLLFEQAKKTGASLIVATHDSRIKGRFKNVTELAA